jgi:glycosyltransferase involved in cell wall biosynthesis
MKNKNPLVSVVIPTYNEERDIADCINSLLKQSYKPIEIIIVDDGSKDKTREIVKKFKCVKLIKGEHKGPGFSRNKGAKKAKGKILSFVDADMTFDKDYIKHLVTPIIEGKSIGTEERFQKAGNLKNVWSKCWGSYTRGYPENVKKGNVFRAILKKEFFKMGGFDPKYGYADDITFYFKYGVKSDIIDGAVCYHRNAENIKEIWKQSRWIGASFPMRWSVLNIFIINFLLTLSLFIIGPVLIPLFSAKKLIRERKINLIFYYIVFYAVRYYGSLSGLMNYILTRSNIR